MDTTRTDQAEGAQPITKAELESETGLRLVVRGLYDPADATRLGEAFERALLQVLPLDEEQGDEKSLEPTEPLEVNERDEQPSQNFLSDLRLIVFADDFVEQAKHWQRELGRRETGATKNDDCRAVGKTFVWRDDSGARHAILLFDLAIGIGLLSDHPLSLALLSHELTHLRFEDWFYDKLGNLKYEETSAYDWPKLTKCYAAICLDEMLADYHAEAHMTADMVRESEDLLVTLARNLVTITRESVAEYRHHHRFDDVWDAVVTAASTYISHLGRVVSLSIDEPEVPPSLLAGLADVSPAFALHPVELRNALLPIFNSEVELSPEALQPAEKVIEAVFTATGLIPKWDGTDLRVDAPFWPGEHERALREHYERLGQE